MHVDAVSSISTLLGVGNNSLITSYLKPSILPDIQKFYVNDGTNGYEVYFVEENGEFVRYLNYTGSLAGFYNARYLFEWVKHKKLAVPVGKYKFFVRNAFKEDVKSHFIMIMLQLPSVETTKKTTFSVDDIFSVIDVLCDIQTPDVSTKAKDIVNAENRVLVNSFYTMYMKQKINDYLQYILNEYSEVFINGRETLGKLMFLYKSFESLEDAFVASDNVEKVFCHGDLSPQHIDFDDDDRVAFIGSWENCHFGEPAEDIAYLVLSSLDKEERTNNIMKILRRYHYKMVDSRKNLCSLKTLKNSYLRYLKYFVFFYLFSLWNQINNPATSYKTKVTIVRRWSHVVEDSYSYEKNEYQVELDEQY
ncbi:unnamed protein product [Bursaphelenchus okinawaensis]|uniref:CHK kinase-like domain-containing protein n=1 Tax=Bursaphelenchus okinawaensis TaxID=465554 RepID=A0A811LAC4_9BILA|nr:unnamed protein product [Bursaphelenchus okinawaensis]CAG9119958.1 unnamed protein product [Bursaphelenchus okinawaensis]